jgi:hypothetical protein
MPSCTTRLPILHGAILFPALWAWCRGDHGGRPAPTRRRTGGHPESGCTVPHVCGLTHPAECHYRQRARRPVHRAQCRESRAHRPRRRIRRRVTGLRGEPARSEFGCGVRTFVLRRHEGAAVRVDRCGHYPDSPVAGPRARQPHRVPGKPSGTRERRSLRVPTRSTNSAL